MGYGIKCTLQLFEEIVISQQPKGEFQNKLFNKVLYPIRNSELMIPNRCTRRLWDKLSMNMSRAQISRNPGLAVRLSSITWSLNGRVVMSCSSPAFRKDPRIADDGRSDDTSCNIPDGETYFGDCLGLCCHRVTHSLYNHIASLKAGPKAAQEVRCSIR
jgi:hypothetical protein